MKDQKKIGILLNYLSEAIKIITALVYTPLMLRILGQSEYGLYQLVSSTVSYLSLLSLGFGSAYIRYYSRYLVKNDSAGIARLNGMFMIVFCSMAVLCFACGGTMVANARAVFGNGLTDLELSKAKFLLSVLIINMALTFPNSVFDCYVMAHEQFLFQKLVRLLQSLLNPFLSLPLLLMGYGSVAMVLVTTVLTVSLLLTNIWFCRKRLNMCFQFRGLRFLLLKEMWVFTFFIFLNQVIDQVNWNVDKFLLGRMSGTAAVAIYGVGGQINTLYLHMSTAISSVFIPKVNRIVAKSDDNMELTELMAKVGRGQFVILALIITGFFFFGKIFISLWAGDGYEKAYEVALWLMIPVTVPLIQNLGIEIQMAKNMHKARSVLYTCLAGMNVVSSIFLIRRWGCVGAAAGTALSLVIGNGLFMNWYYHKRIGLNMYAFWKEIIRFVPALLLACLCGSVWVKQICVQNWGQLMISILGYASIYGISMWLFGLNTYEKQLVFRVLKKVRIVREEL